MTHGILRLETSFIIQLNNFYKPETLLLENIYFLLFRNNIIAYFLSIIFRTLVLLLHNVRWENQHFYLSFPSPSQLLYHYFFFAVVYTFYILFHIMEFSYNISAILLYKYYFWKKYTLSPFIPEISENLFIVPPWLTVYVWE